MSNTELPKNYDAATVEEEIYERWMASGFFNPETAIKAGVTAPDAEPFSIVMPPPNVTGTLHLGHAFEHTLQDISVRFQRMRGRRTLWIPGTDHAAIATNAKYEKQLAKEGKSRHDFTREEYFKQVQAFALENQQEILGQLKIIGDSVDWSRLAFTLDEQREKAVHAAFKKMYEQGLIYRGSRIVNWDPKGQTTISDDEIIHEETTSTLYTFRYAKDFPIPIATTRPETKVGDVAVAVHPDDARYQEYINREFDVVFCDAPLHIKVLADKEIDPSYGTGAVGITPAHSMVDWDIAERHHLPFKKVINEYARIENASELLNGKKVLEARALVVAWLKENNLLEKEEEITNNISKSDRTGGIIEPLPKLQWFVDVDKPFQMQNSHIDEIATNATTTLKEIMRTVVERGHITILPDNFRKIYMHWVDNLRDWCISRQILYGHRIPVWYRKDEVRYSPTAPEGEGWTQDEDTLDTWFSSGLWTFSTLGWPDDTEDLHTYHPTSVMSPGYEILSLWVSRMIMLSGYLLGDIPFRHVYIHGIVRDKDGRKFSKSLNNGIDPLDVIAKHGTDALRMALVVGVAAGSDSKFDIAKVRGYQHFANKLWNIARFVLANKTNPTKPEPTTDADRTILSSLNTLIQQATVNLEKYLPHEAAQHIYAFAWHELADVYLEASKPQLAEASTAENTRAVLTHCLITTLKLLHPFMPFVTEEIWSKMHGTDDPKKLLMVQPWPVVQ